MKIPNGLIHSSILLHSYGRFAFLIFSDGRPLHASINNTVGATSIGFFCVLILHMRSIEHRTTVNSAKERISIATFHRHGMGSFCK
ncbi:unnamed protein product [Lupinus luteus]|uniref:Uncharacterized protein n=1 Tax=Lupinus luteus TaxID=3873 RepID=A0AAV1XQ48_LUPLU